MNNEDKSGQVLLVKNFLGLQLIFYKNVASIITINEIIMIIEVIIIIFRIIYFVIYFNGFQDTARLQEMNLPIHWLKKEPEFYKHAPMTYHTIQSNYIYDNFLTNFP